MVKRLKYKIINPKTKRIMHHSYNKKNAQEWVNKYCKIKPYRIKKINK